MLVLQMIVFWRLNVLIKMSLDDMLTFLFALLPLGTIVTSRILEVDATGSSITSSLTTNELFSELFFLFPLQLNIQLCVCFLNAYTN